MTCSAAHNMAGSLTNELRFYALGDFGYPSPEMKRVAGAMQLYSEIAGPPHFILGLGDNFYPSGVESVADRQFKTSWENLFLQHSLLRVPWHISQSSCSTFLPLSPHLRLLFVYCSLGES
jgi:tartrate-resistant acid phosphatase type 5